MASIITLNSGNSMPAFGFGTWLCSPGVVGQSVRQALDCGYRHIDCAEVYENESEIGIVFNEVFSSGKYKREDVFITTKLWVKDFTIVEETIQKQLKELQLDYIDLYLVHLPFELDKDLPTLIPAQKGVGVIGYTPDRFQEVWKLMEGLVAKGFAKSIGVSNFTIYKLEQLLKRSPTIKPACNQVEVHPYLPQNRLRDYCRKQGIAIVAYSPLGNPGSVFQTDGEPVLKDSLLMEVANKHKVTVAQVLLAWNLALGNGVLVKSVNESRIQENFGCLGVKLSIEDMKAINDIKTRHRTCPQAWALKVDQEVSDLWDGEYLD